MYNMYYLYYRILSSFELVLNTYPVNSTGFENVLLIQTTYAASIQEVTAYTDDNEMADLSFTVSDNFGSNLKANENSINFGEYNEDESTASIKLPPSVLTNVERNFSTNTRIVYSIYDSHKLFFRRENLSEKDKYLVVGSTIISASVFDDDVFNETVNEFPEPVIITLRKDEVSLLISWYIESINSRFCRN